MRIDIATLFPEMCESVLSESIIGRARAGGFIELYCHNIRDYSPDKHRRVDDAPFGGGMGMVMQAEPIYRCYSDISASLNAKPHVIYMSPQGKTFTQQMAREYSEMSNIFILCGHYEGVDERVLEEIVDEELSIGDYVLTGGELPALVVIDAIARMCEGVLSSDECFTDESHWAGLLEHPQYTRPAVWHKKEVPEVLLGGHHANIIKWRHEQAVLRTAAKRPDMLAAAELAEKNGGNA
ncbi:MAG: tRNA (guanosine(37)-N1)-methyltransferase TrmD [Hydrogenoanaerobacterium sp.]